MSNTEGSTERAAARHRPAIWGIVVAVLAAIIAAVVLLPWGGPEAPPSGEVAPPAVEAPGNTAPAPATPAPATPAPG